MIRTYKNLAPLIKEELGNTVTLKDINSVLNALTEVSLDELKKGNDIKFNRLIRISVTEKKEECRYDGINHRYVTSSRRKISTKIASPAKRIIQ